MAKRRGLEQKLAALEELRSNPSSDRAIEQLRQALASKTNSLAARAAQIAADLEGIQIRLTDLQQVVRALDILGQMRHALDQVFAAAGQCFPNDFRIG